MLYTYKFLYLLGPSLRNFSRMVRGFSLICMDTCLSHLQLKESKCHTSLIITNVLGSTLQTSLLITDLEYMLPYEASHCRSEIHFHGNVEGDCGFAFVKDMTLWWYNVKITTTLHILLLQKNKGMVRLPSDHFLEITHSWSDLVALKTPALLALGSS